MNKLLSLSLLIFISSAYAADDEDFEFETTPALTSTVEARAKEREFKAYKSHWLTSFGFEHGKYEVPWEFRGEKKNLRPSDQGLTGGRLGFGRELYLGKGFMTTTKLESYYIGSLFTKAQNGGSYDREIEFASTKKTGQLWGVDASQSISYLFEMKTRNPMMGEWTYLTVEPYVEAGIGKAYAHNRVNYKYELNAINEYYRHGISDELINAKIAAGINFTSRQGFFLYLKATQNKYDLIERKTTGQYAQNGDPTVYRLNKTEKSADINAVTVYALGGGYKF